MKRGILLSYVIQRANLDQNTNACILLLHACI